MNFSQLHERLRAEVARRIKAGTLTAASLAQRTGLAQPHISNFLGNKRRFSPQALDRVLGALGLSLEQLLLDAPPPPTAPSDTVAVPLVSETAAIHDDVIANPLTREPLRFPPEIFPAVRGDATRKRQRFVALRLTPEQAQPMAPLLTPNGTVILDRHATTPAGISEGPYPIYAVRLGTALAFRYATVKGGALLLHAHNPLYSPESFPLPLTGKAAGMIIGRVIQSHQGH